MKITLERMHEPAGFEVRYEAELPTVAEVSDHVIIEPGINDNRSSGSQQPRV